MAMAASAVAAFRGQNRTVPDGVKAAGTAASPADGPAAVSGLAAAAMALVAVVTAAALIVVGLTTATASVIIPDHLDRM
jgi:hypothetical protein